jgi:4a-hydroxytetrahydrobiopterin dehydratase
MEPNIKNWDMDDNKLVREYGFKSFAQAMNFVNSVAEVAEKINHHPDIYLSFNKVKLTLFTHSENKITDKDYQLAEKISEIR